MPYELKPSAPDEEISYFNKLWEQELPPIEVIENNIEQAEVEGVQLGNEIVFLKIFSMETQTSCGYLSYWISGKQALLDSFFLEQSYRRRGIGEHMLKQLESKLKQSGFISISLTVLKENEAAVNLYRKLGYQIQSLGKEEGKVYLMEKTI
jgi:ribosomal protein S18 acetylase RimI-like enzyme